LSQNAVLFGQNADALFPRNQVRKSGVLARSFAGIPPMLIRYRHGASAPLHDSVPSDLARIDWQGLSAFDYVLIRARANPTVGWGNMPRIRSFRPHAAERGGCARHRVHGRRGNRVSHSSDQGR